MSKIIPKPKAWPFIGTLGSLIASGGAEKLHKYVDNRHKQLGPIYKEKIGPTEGIFISNPDYMRRVFALEGRYPQHVIPDAWKLYNKIYGQKRGLLFMDGKEWHKYRKMLNTVILKPEMSIITPALEKVGKELAKTLNREGQVQDLEQQLYNWSLKSIIAVLGGKNTEIISKLIENLSKNVHEIFKTSGKLSLMPVEIVQKLNLPIWQRFVISVNNSNETAQILLNTIKKTESSGLLKQLQTIGISDLLLNRIIIDLILAAGDTTAYTTQWLFYLLATHQDIQNSIYESINKNSNLPENVKLKTALRETLRLYPVAPFITRYLPETIEIDGYCLEKNSLVIMSLYTSGRDALNFPEPNKFQPDRWNRLETGYQNVNNPHASLPFAMGARSCIGRKIAETQITTTTGIILQNFNITCLNSNPVDIKLNLITVPSVPIQIKLLRRSCVI